MTSAWLYDGVTAVRQSVELSRGGAGLRIRFADGNEEEVPAQRLRHVASRPDAEIYGRTDNPGWRLGLSGDIEEIAGVVPARERYGRWIDRIGLIPALAAGLALSALLIFAGSRFPAWLAPAVPESWEQRFGDTLVGDFGGRFCEGSGGQEALTTLVQGLSRNASKLRVRVVHVPMMNAAALPGGNIVIFDGLLKQADTPDELAGILAHEIGHIEERHTTRMMIRHFGLGTLIAGLGGTTGANVETLLSASYSRSAEREADDHAIRTLARSGISPVPTADFFRRLAHQEAKIGRASGALAYLSSHPMSADRQRRFRESAVAGRRYRSPLTREQWDALFNICFNDPRRDEKALSLDF